MVEKQHKHLLRGINGYIEEMEKTGESNFGLSSKLPKINPSDFFIPSAYINEQGKELPCFLVTKKGCKFIANKLTGEKGRTFFILLFLSQKCTSYTPVTLFVCRLAIP